MQGARSRAILRSAMAHARRASSVVVLALVTFVACGDDDEASEPGAAATAAQTSESEQRAHQTLYDADGNLLESDDVVAGLRLPRGLETILDHDREHIYESRVPIAKINRYFGPRLVTGDVSRRGSGAVFRAAVPRDARGGIVRLDVSILAAGRDRTRVTVYELPPVPTQPPPEAVTLEHLEEDARRLE